jgi:hypothetical protein
VPDQAEHLMAGVDPDGRDGQGRSDTGHAAIADLVRGTMAAPDLVEVMCGTERLPLSGRLRAVAWSGPPE